MPRVPVWVLLPLHGDVYVNPDHLYQERLYLCQGSQCGFCSPGMVMSMLILIICTRSGCTCATGSQCGFCSPCMVMSMAVC